MFSPKKGQGVQIYEVMDVLISSVGGSFHNIHKDQIIRLCTLNILESYFSLIPQSSEKV